MSNIATTRTAVPCAVGSPFWEPGAASRLKPTGDVNNLREHLIREFHIQMRLRRCRGQEEFRTEAEGSAYRTGGMHGSFPFRRAEWECSCGKSAGVGGRKRKGSQDNRSALQKTTGLQKTYQMVDRNTI